MVGRDVRGYDRSKEIKPVVEDIILLAKQDGFSKQAVTVAEILFGPRLKAFTGQVGDPLPEEVAEGRPRFLISFLSPWIVPAAVLDRAGTALNFHPGSTDYPGIGCYNFALYEEAQRFGAVCHHMLAKVDTGAIVEERVFPVLPTDCVETLKYRTMVTMLAMLHDIGSLISIGAELPAAPTQWTRRPFTRREMEALKRIEPDMPAAEVRRRVRATTYPGYPGPYVAVGEERFYAPAPQRPAIA
jgi:methionyl-tRNA formyltransferase